MLKVFGRLPLGARVPQGFGASLGEASLRLSILIIYFEPCDAPTTVLLTPTTVQSPAGLRRSNGGIDSREGRSRWGQAVGIATHKQWPHVGLW
jgi:hypothetical protein